MPTSRLYITSLKNLLFASLERRGSTARDCELSWLILFDLLKKVPLAELTVANRVKALHELQLPPGSTAGYIAKPAEWLLAARRVEQFFHDVSLAENEVLLQGYLLALKARGCSRSTIKNYLSDIRQLLAFATDATITDVLTETRLLDFSRGQERVGLASSTIRRKLTTAAQFAKWLADEHGIESAVAVALGNLALNYGLEDGVRAGSTKQTLSVIPDSIIDSPSANQVTTGKPITEAKSIDSISTPINYRPASLVGVTHSKSAPTTLPDSSVPLAVTADTPQRSVATTPQSGPTRAQVAQGAKSRRSRFPKVTAQTALTSLALIISALGFGLFARSQFLTDPNTSFAYPANLTRPARTLSFQGRLTDSGQNPVTSATNMTFRLMDSGPSTSGGSELWSGINCSVDPDQDGIFSVGLGDECGAEIDADVFSENANVWLQVEVGAEVLSPRQSIKSVAYALNSETLQGYPASASATESTVVVMNSAGQIVLGNSVPVIKATSTNGLTIEGRSLNLVTTTGSNGNITLDPDGIGQILAKSNLQVDGAATVGGILRTQKSLQVDQYATIAASLSVGYNTAPAGPGNAVFSGNVGIGTTNPGALFHIEKSSAGAGIGAFIHNSAASTLGNSAELGFGTWTNEYGGAPGGKISLINTNAGSGANAFTFFTKNTSGVVAERVRFDSQGNVGIGTTNPGAKLDIGTAGSSLGTLRLAGNTSGYVQIQPSAAAGSWTLTLPTGAGTNNFVLATNGSGVTSWVDPALVASGAIYWTQTLGTIQPKNTTVDLLVGGTATSSAKAAFLNINSGTPTASVSAGTAGGAFLTATGNLSTTARQNLTLGNSTAFNTTGNILLNPNGTGNVGVGTTSPNQKLDVYGNIAIGVNQIGGGNGWGQGGGASSATLKLYDSATGYSILNNQTYGIRLQTLGTDRITILNGGNVGIGTTNPNAAKLEVAGQVKITGGTPGTNKVLTSDASGLASWSSITGIGGVGGSGTLNYVPKWTPDGTNLGNSSIFDNGNVGIGTTAPTSKLYVNDVLTGSSAGGTGIDFQVAHGNFGGSQTTKALNIAIPNLGVNTNSLDAYGLYIDDIYNYYGANTASGGSKNYGLYVKGGANNYFAGNVGIGTTTPGSVLDIYKNQAAGFIGQRVTGYADNSGGSQTLIGSDIFLSGNQTQNIYGSRINIESESATAVTNAYGLYIGAFGGAGNITNRFGVYQAGSSEKNYFAGNVGIGTTNPEALLNLEKDGVPELRISSLNDTNGKYPLLRFMRNSATAGLIGVEDVDGGQIISGTSGNELVIRSYDDLILATNGLARVTVVNGGNVGIGTTAPTHKLELAAGTSAAEGIGFGTDTELYRSAANTLALASGDSFNIVSGALQIAGNTAIDSSRNANFATSVTLGGDVVLSRGAANRLDLASGDSLNLVLGGLQVAGTEVITSGRLVRGANGSVSTPTFSFSADTNTGMYSGGTDILRLATAGTDRLTILADGNVGIGTTNPDQKLHLLDGSVGGIGSGPNIRLELNDDNIIANQVYGAFEWEGQDVSSNANGVRAKLAVIADPGNGALGDTAMVFHTSGASDTTLSERMRIDRNGNVGIGTTTPGSYKLNVNGKIYAATQGTAVGEVLTAGRTINTTGPLSGGGALTGDLTLSCPTCVTSSSFTGFANPSATIGLTAVNGSATTAMRSDAAPALSQAIVPTWTGTHTFSNATYSALFTGGNVGIGTTSPDFALQVNGVIAPETTDQDLGTTSLRWDLLANTINADSTVTLTGLGSGTDNTVVILNSSNQLTTDEIDAKVWGTGLVDTASGTTNYVTKWTSGGETIGNSIIFDNGTNVGVGTTSPGVKLAIDGSTYIASSLLVGANSIEGDFVQYNDSLDGATLNTANWTTTGTVTQSDSISIVGAGAWTTRGITGKQAYRRTNSLTLVADVSVNTANSATGMFGFSSHPTTMNYTNMPHALYFNGGSIHVYENGANRGVVGSYLASTTYRLRISVTTTGAVYYISSDGGTTWIRLYDGTGNTITTSPLYVRYVANNSATTTTIDNVTVSNGQDVYASSQLFNNNLTIGNGNLLVNSGNVGIGVTNPGAKLEVAGQVKITGGSPGVNKVLTSDANGLASWTALSGIGVTSVTGTANQITASPTTGAVVLTLPSDLRAPGTFNAVTSIATGAGAGTVRIDASGNLTNIGTIAATGAVTIGGTEVISTGRLIKAANGAVGTPAFSFSADTNTGMYSGGTDILRFSTAGANRMSIIANGNVGIGTTAPGAQLDVTNAGSNTFALIVGSDVGASTRTNATRKFVRVGMPHYTNAEEPVSLITGDSDGTNNIVTVGGGTGLGNAATSIQFNTAANASTVTGTTRMTIASNGAVNIANLSASLPVKTDASKNLISGAINLASSTEVTGTLPINRGGTNTTATPTAGGITYGTGTAYAFTSAGTAGQALLSGGAGAPTFGTLGLTYGGTNANLSGVATGGLIYKAASALAGTGALTGVLKGNGSSAPTAMTGITNYVTRWTDTNTLGTGVLFDNGTNVGIGTATPVSKLDVTTTALGVTQTNASGLLLANTTAAAAGAQQISPAVRWSGRGWKTAATAASQSVDFRSYVVPVQGTANPTGYLTFESSINGGTYVNALNITSSGNVGIGTTSPGARLSVVGDASISRSASDTTSKLLTVSHGTAMSRVNVATGDYDSNGMAEFNFYGHIPYLNSGNYTITASRFISSIDHAGLGVVDNYALYCEPTGGTYNKCGGTVGWTSSSDRRIKKDIVTLDNALFKITNLRGVSFFRSDDGSKNKQIGFIAQEVLPIVPEVVFYDYARDLYSIEYGALTALLVEGVKEQHSLILSLQSELNNQNIMLDSTGDLLIGTVADHYTVSEVSNGQIVSNIIGVSQAVIGRVRAGLTTTQDLIVSGSTNLASLTATGASNLASVSATSLSLTTDSLSIAGQSLRGYIESVVNQMQLNNAIALPEGSVIDELAVNSLSTEELATADLSASGAATINTADITNLSVAENATIAGKLEVASDATINGELNTNTLLTELLQADTTLLGSLLTETATVLGDATVSGSLAVSGDITSSGSARLQALESKLAEFEKIQATTAELFTASVSGTLYANHIADLDRLMAESVAPTFLQQLIGYDPLATDSARVISQITGVDLSETLVLDPIGLGELATDSVLIGADAGFFKQYLQVNGNTALGGDVMIAGDLRMNQGLTISSNEIAYAPVLPESCTPVEGVITDPLVADSCRQLHTLKIQSSGAGALDLMNGLVVLADGTVTITGNVTFTQNITVQDTLLTDLISPTSFDRPIQLQVAGVSTESGEVQRSRFEIVNELGTPVATISAQGNADFAGKASFGEGVAIASQDLTTQVATIAGQLSSTKTSGKAKVVAGTSQIIITNSNVTEDSLIYVTPVGSTGNQTLYVKQQTGDDPLTAEVNEASFTVGTDFPLVSDATFNWWVVN